jgi:hypothetical protein
MRLLLFENEDGTKEYVVFTDDSRNSDQEWARPGFELSLKLDIPQDGQNWHRLPCECELEK